MIWTQHWYPLAHVRELPKNAPSSHRLLDEPIALAVGFDRLEAFMRE